MPSDYLSSQPSSSAYPTSFSLKGDIVGKGKMMTESQGKGSFKGMKIKSKGKEKEKSKKISKPTLFSDYPTFTPSFPPVKKKDKSNKKGMGGDSLKNVGLSSKAPIQASSTKSPAIQPSQSSPPAILPTSVSPTNIQLLDGPTISPLTTAPSQPSNSGSPTSKFLSQN